MMTSGLRLLIFVWPELGHLRPMLALAASARQMGSHVVFAGIPDSEHTIREAGFPFEPILGDLFPKGGVWGDPPGAARLAWYRSRVQRAETGLKRVADGALKPLLRRIRPGLCLADQFVFFLTLPAYGERIPAAVVHTSFPAGHRDGLPPARTPLVPSDTFWFRWQLRWAQTTSWLRYARDHYGLSIVGLDVSLADWTRRIAAANGYSVARVRADNHPLDLLPTIPQIVLTPPELDFPRRGLAGRYYIGPFVWQGPKVDNFPWGSLDSRKRLIYCAFGSQTQLYGRTGLGLFEAVATAVRRDAQLQLVIAAGRYYPQLHPLTSPQIVVVETAPQQKILERADVFVTHGGLGSIRESVMAGVPMLVIPLANDQPGNAARVGYHGLGVVGSTRDVSASTTYGRLRTVLDDDKYRRAVRQMQLVFQHRRDSGAGLDLLLELAAGGNAPVAFHAP